ncbi:MAG: hypothetical protein LBT74_05245 [Acidobacteriota bacterium]|nr:hypothetical protein [Acidobacteriota bacterium]
MTLEETLRLVVEKPSDVRAGKDEAAVKAVAQTLLCAARAIKLPDDRNWRWTRMVPGLKDTAVVMNDDANRFTVRYRDVPVATIAKIDGDAPENEKKFNCTFETDIRATSATIDRMNCVAAALGLQDRFRL